MPPLHFEASLPRPLECGPGGGADVEPTGDWDVVAKSFEALADELEV